MPHFRPGICNFRPDGTFYFEETYLFVNFTLKYAHATGRAEDCIIQPNKCHE